MSSKFKDVYRTRDARKIDFQNPFFQFNFTSFHHKSDVLRSFWLSLNKILQSMEKLCGLPHTQFSWLSPEIQMNTSCSLSSAMSVHLVDSTDQPPLTLPLQFIYVIQIPTQQTGYTKPQTTGLAQKTRMILQDLLHSLSSFRSNSRSAVRIAMGYFPRSPLFPASKTS